MAGKRTLLVEGVDDEHVIKHVCGNRGVPHLDAIEQHGGVDELLADLPVWLKQSEVAVLGVMVDADTNLAGRWQSVRRHLVGAGYEGVPTTPVRGGAIVDPPAGRLLPRVGIWIMPDNESDGILEDFLRSLVPTDSLLFRHVESSVAAIPDRERRFSRLSEPKARIHTWLAWQKEPGKPLGTAITARYLDPDVPQVDALVSWLNRLFFAGLE